MSLSRGPNCRSLLLLSYGQSNADAFVVGPRPDSSLLTDGRVLTMTEGTGLRGPAYLPDGRTKPAVGMFHRDGKRLAASELGPVHALAEHDLRNSSMLHAAGSVILDRLNYDRVYARVFARGGARLIGKPSPNSVVTGIYRLEDGRLSPILLELLSTVEQMAAHARAAGGMAENVYLLFIHGEADRNTPRDDYRVAFLEAKQRIDAHLRSLRLRPHWLITQTGGTGHDYTGNDWLSRQACLDIVDAETGNLSFLGPLYPYPLADSIHHDAEAKALIGELAAHAIEALEDGCGWHTPRPLRWHRAAETEIVIEVDSNTVLEVHETGESFDNLGFSLNSREANRIVGAELAGDRAIRVTLERPIGGRLRLDYAFGRREPGMAVTPRKVPFGGGQLRTSWSADSALLPGAKLFKWLPGFRIEIGRDQTQGGI